MALPSKIRKALGSEELVLSTGFDKCVFGFSPDGWEKMVQAGFDKPVFTADGRLVRRQFFSEAEVIEYDAQGRITVPVELRKYAELKPEVVVVGAGDHFEIWEKKEWEKVKSTLPAGPF
ncbi:cell division/cell wall cluster transcriptional repressor MraZ [Patescibacteria group bacterium]|nr:cell division/cell wall cluster transcriptional repressor MraZ [Patescibacteria group bacterium]